MSDDSLVAAALERVMERLDQIEARLDTPPRVVEDDWPDWNEDPGSSPEPAPPVPQAVPVGQYRPPQDADLEWEGLGTARPPVSDSPVQQETSSGHYLTAEQIQIAMQKEWLLPRKRFDQGRVPAAEDRV